jgi:hypothetical protein
MKKFQAKNSKKLICSASVSPKGEISDLTCHVVEAVSNQQGLDKLTTIKDSYIRNRLESKLDHIQQVRSRTKVSNFRKERCSHIKRKVSNSRCSSCPTISFTLGNGLFSEDPNAIPNSDGSYGPYVISSPGNYRLENSPQMEISGSSSSNPNTFIIIDSSDVHLDLCNNVLTGSGNLTAPFSPSPSIPGGITNDTRVDASQGIYINPTSGDLDNISIANGKLQYFSINGISYFNVNNVKLENLIIENCSDVITLFVFPLGGIVGYTGKNLTINNVRFFHNYNYDVSLISVSNATITNCMSAQLRGGATGVNVLHEEWLANEDYVTYGSFNTPFEIFFCDNVLLENCNVTDSKAGAVPYGLCLLYGGVGGVVRNCNVSDVAQTIQDISIFGPDFTFGIEIEGIAFGSTIGSLVENCTVQNIGCAVQTLYSTYVYPFSGNGVAAFNVESGQGAVFKNCYATNVYSAGKLTSVVPDRVSNKLVSDNAATGFQRQIDANSIGNNAMFIDCIAQNVNGGQGASEDMKSPGMGFAIYDGFGDQPFIPNPTSTIFQNCSAQDCFGSIISAGFGFQYPAYFPFPVVFENCISTYDRIHNPNQYSNGFLIPSYGNNLVFKNCTATGHTLDGFRIAGYTVDDQNTKSILDGCIANANSGYGFFLENTVKDIEITKCKATNNGLDGFNINGRNIVMRNNVADLNAKNGFKLEPYFPFYAKVATDSDLSDLSIYVENGYDVVYYENPINGEGFDTYFLQFVPRDLFAPLPEYLPINGVQVYNGDIVLVKDELDGTLNGVYRANNYGGFSRWNPQGFMNVFDLPEDGGGYQFGSPWGTADLTAVFSNGNIILGPNTLWPASDTYWVKPNGCPNKIMDATYYTQDDSLVGTIINFDGFCVSNTLGTAPCDGYQYTSQAFIKIFNSDFSGLLAVAAADLITGTPFNLTLDSNIPGAAHIQYGFETIGPNADPATVSDLGNVIISTPVTNATPCWQLVRVDPWRAPYTVFKGTKVLVDESNYPNLSPGPVMYVLENDVNVDSEYPYFKANKHILADQSEIVLDGNKAGLNGHDGIHNHARDILVRNNTADKNGHKGIHDESESKKNIYTNNHARGNPKGNMDVD